MAFLEFNMMTKPFVICRSFLVMSAGVMLCASGERCLSQDAEHKENELQQIQILLGTEGLDVVSPALKGHRSGPTEQPMLPPGTKSLSDLHSPGHRNAQKRSPETKYFREQISQQIDFLAQQGTDVQKLRELVERLQLAMENSEQGATRDVAVAVFAVPAAVQDDSEEPKHEGPPRAGIAPAGPPDFQFPNSGPPGLLMRGLAELHPDQGLQLHHPQVHGLEGAFAEDRRRIAALTESAERIAQAGLPEVAQGLRERAGQLERELAEKQERMQQEERQRTESAMPERQEQRRAGIERGDDPTPPLRELHEQMEQLRRDMHKLSEQIADLTSLIQQHHNPRTDRGRHEEMDEDGDDEDGDDEDGDDDEMDDDEASDD